MDHRYGRHGSRAWLRWRKRHYFHPATSLVPVVQPVVIHVYIPITVERIIIIVSQPEGFEAPEDRRVVPSTSMNIQYPSGKDTGEIQRVTAPKLIPLLQRRAERSATDDIEDLKSLAESGKYILIHRERIVRKGRKHARHDISNDQLDQLDETISYEDLLQIYQHAYERKIDESIAQLGDQVTEITDEKEKQLRDALNEDRAHVYSGGWHARDLVLVRFLQIYYGHSLDDVDVDVLQERHVLIDRYERYLRDFQARNEVIWPDQESF
jgi:hypothetical protein